MNQQQQKIQQLEILRPLPVRKMHFLSGFVCENEKNMEYIDSDEVAVDRSAIHAAERARDIGIGTTSGVLVLIIFILCVYFARKRKNGENLAMVIQKAMVIFITIGEYDHHPQNPDQQLRNTVLEDLAIERDTENLSKLFGPDYLNYHITQQSEHKLHWTQDEVVKLLQNAAEKLNKNINDYDGLFVAISSHGWQNHICTSDYKMIQHAAIHRLFSYPYPAIRDIPRVFLFDCCDGGDRRKSVVRDSNADKGKNFTIDNIEMKNENNVDIHAWERGDHNPDYKLVEINAANTGFQSFLSYNKGSYMIHGFVDKMIKDLDNNKQRFIYEIFDEVQKELQELGKQQIKPVYYNGTRFIKLKRNVKGNVSKEKNGGQTELIRLA